MRCTAFMPVSRNVRIMTRKLRIAEMESAVCCSIRQHPSACIRTAYVRTRIMTRNLRIAEMAVAKESQAASWRAYLYLW